MKKTSYLLAVIFCSFSLSLHAAKFPQSGYVDPYDAGSYTGEEYGEAIYWDGDVDDGYDSGWNSSQGSGTMVTMATGPCPDCRDEYDSYGPYSSEYWDCVDSKVCAGAQPGGVCAPVRECLCTCSAFVNGTGCPEPIHQGGNVPLNGCILVPPGFSVGSFFPLFIFALCYGMYFMYRRKRNISAAINL